MNRAVFIDRDGTMNRDVPYCSRPEDFELLHGVAQGIRLLNEHGFKVVVVTNQSGIARSYFTEQMLNKISDKMRAELAKRGAYLDAIYYCPHHPNENCDCRKPKPMLILKAAAEHEIALNDSFLIGDKAHDVEAGYVAGCRTILISPTCTLETLPNPAKPNFVARDFLEAAKYIINRCLCSFYSIR